jgi:ribonuclease-3
MKLQELQDRVNYQFRDLKLLTEALTHSSVVHETGGAQKRDNQRLEFLGDAVLQVILTDWLFRIFPTGDEGLLTRLRSHLANRHTLYRLAHAMSLGDFLVLGKGEEASGGRKRQSNLSNAYEALIGAIYLDGGLFAAGQFVRDQFDREVENLQVRPQRENPKGVLQERLQARSTKGPTYRITSEEGPDHAKRFEAIVEHNAEELGRGVGASKKEAEMRAAEAALKKLDETDGVAKHDPAGS